MLNNWSRKNKLSLQVVIAGPPQPFGGSSPKVVGESGCLDNSKKPSSSEARWSNPLLVIQKKTPFWGYGE